MSNIQLLRGILLLNNSIAATLLLVAINDELVGIISATVLLVSWIMNLAAVGYITLRLWTGKSHARLLGAYAAIPVTEEADLSNKDDDREFVGILPLPISALVTLADFVFAITTFILFMVCVVNLGWDAVEAVGTVGLIVAATVHIFFAFYGFRWCVLGQYSIRLSIIKRSEGESHLDDMGQPSGAQSPQRFGQQECQQLSPGQNHGSPSAKPYQDVGKGKATEPSATNALLDDQE